MGTVVSSIMQFSSLTEDVVRETVRWFKTLVSVANSQFVS